MTIIKFKGKVRRSGSSNVVTIPSDFVNYDMVPLEKDLEFTIEVPDE